MPRRLPIAACLLGLLLACTLGACARQAPRSTGEVRFEKDASSPFDGFDRTAAHAGWINRHFYRMLVYAPHFRDVGAEGWYGRGLVYDDAYAVYTGSRMASEHPAWILKDAAGRRLYIPFECSRGACPQYAGDISDAAYRRYWIANLKATLGAGSYSGVWIDDVNMSADVGNGEGARTPAINYKGERLTDEAWRRYMATFMREIRQALPHADEIVQNQVWYEGCDSGPCPANRYTREADEQANWINRESGLNDSRLTGGVGVRGSGSDEFSLYSLFSYIDELHALGDGVILAGGAEGIPEQEYNLAGYFLINNGHDMVQGGGNRETPASYWAGYEVSLGSAEGARMRSPAGLWERRFTNGLVLLNEPGASTKIVKLARVMLTADGEKVTSVALPEKSGAVLRLGPIG
jgi:hypothetical protein